MGPPGGMGPCVLLCLGGAVKKSVVCRSRIRRCGFSTKRASSDAPRWRWLARRAAVAGILAPIGFATVLGASASGPQARTAAHAAPARPLYANLRVRAWKLLDDAVASDKVRSRSDALSALSILQSDRHALALMTQSLADKDEGVRALAATSLGNMKARSAIPALRKAVDDPSPVVSFAAARSLWKMGDRSGRELFYDVLSGERKTQPGLIQKKVEEAKQDVHNPKTLALIGIDQASGAFLGPFSMGVSMVEEYAKNTGSPVQALCASLLSQDNTPDTIEQLSMALGNSNWSVRAAAAKALARMHDRKIIPELEQMMETDKEQAARFVAAAAILKLTA